MQKINYQKKLEELVEKFTSKPTLLLHSCCGPCSTRVIDYLKDYFKITVYYYNPNIEPNEEYLKRKEEQLRFISEYNKKNEEKIEYLEACYEHDLFMKTVDQLKQEKEGGVRCKCCYYLRLENTANMALKKNFAYFGTTLTVSPHKDSSVINKIGEMLESKLGVAYIYGDFKKQDGYQKSIILAKEYNLYRQNYCGCLYGKEHM